MTVAKDNRLTSYNVKTFVTISVFLPIFGPLQILIKDNLQRNR